MKIKKFGLIGLIICIVIGIIFFFPQNNQKETKKIKKEKNIISFEHSRI